MKYRIIKKCQICNSKLFNFLDLGKQPLCDDLKTKPNKNKFYKLQVKICKKCFTAYQKYNVERKILFPKKYHYRAANTKDVILGMKDLVNKANKLKKNSKNKTILDIGCNDGSLLDLFKKKNFKTFGVEPTNAYKEAQSKGHTVYNNYFDYKFSNFLKKKIKKVDIITFTNVFAHIENFKDLIKGLKNLITNNTVLIIENHYFAEVIKKKQFDTFYHEHPRTYSLNSFYKISGLLNIDILKYNFVRRYNGNIRVFLGKSLYKKNNKKLKKDLSREKNLIKNTKNFQKNVDKWKINKKKQINNLVKKYGPLPAKAFPGRASILLNLLGLNKNHISAIYEKNLSLKINKYAPGTDIKILKEKYYFKEKEKKLMLNLAWHIKDEIKKYLRNELNYNGKVINIISKGDFK